MVLLRHLACECCAVALLDRQRWCYLLRMGVLNCCSVARLLQMCLMALLAAAYHPRMFTVVVALLAGSPLLHVSQRKSHMGSAVFCC
jgi:hypothetical protein